MDQQPEPTDLLPVGEIIPASLSASTERIKALVVTARHSVVEIGRELLAVHQTLPRGQFDGWLQTEFQWSRRVAVHMMQVARAFASHDAKALQHIEAGALYALAGPHTPVEARQAAVDAEGVVSRAQAQRMIDEALDEQRARLATEQYKGRALDDAEVQKRVDAAVRRVRERNVQAEERARSARRIMSAVRDLCSAPPPRLAFACLNADQRMTLMDLMGSVQDWLKDLDGILQAED